MSNVESTIETTQRLIYMVPNPTNWREVSLAMSMMQRALEQRGIETQWDNVVSVEADEGEIRFVALIDTSRKADL